jgi:broad specificity phosphatase PhoE
MPSAKLVIGGAAATTALGVRVARTLYSRWRLLPEADRRRIESLAEDLKDQALALRGSPDRARAEADLNSANETFAAALVETAEADPEVNAEEVQELREDLRRELERLASADIKAWRTRHEAAPPPG